MLMNDRLPSPKRKHVQSSDWKTSIYGEFGLNPSSHEGVKRWGFYIYVFILLLTFFFCFLSISLFIFMPYTPTGNFGSIVSPHVGVDGITNYFMVERGQPSTNQRPLPPSYSFIDNCISDRRKAIPSTTAIPIAFTLLVLVHLFFGLMHRHLFEWLRNTFTVLTWYYATYLLCWALKFLLIDSNCSAHGNSISGHYTFFFFMSLSLLHLGFIGRRFTKSFPFPPVWLVIFLFIFLWLWVITITYILFQTFFGGFHSLRQIIYGISLAFFSFSLMTFIFPDVEKPSSLLFLSMFALFSTLVSLLFKPNPLFIFLTLGCLALSFFFSLRFKAEDRHYYHPLSKHE